MDTEGDDCILKVTGYRNTIDNSSFLYLYFSQFPCGVLKGNKQATKKPRVARCQTTGNILWVLWLLGQVGS